MAQHHRALPYQQSTRPGTTTATQTQTETPVLRLRAVQDEPAPNVRSRPRLQWAEDVIDNEGMGKKKSKLCCIYHAPRVAGESSSESSSDSSDSDSDGGAGDDGKARMGSNGKRRRTRKEEDRRGGNEDGEGDHDHDHDHDHDGCNHSHPATERRAEKTAGGKGQRKSRNAYEVQPKLPRRNKATETAL